jgi:hypothetical protein
MVIPKGLLINLIFLVILIFIYIYLEDKTDLFQFKSKRNFVSMKKSLIQSRLIKLYDELKSNEAIINSKNSIDNVIAGIFDLIDKKDNKKKFVKIVSGYQS